MSKAKKIAIICDDSGNISGTNLSGTNTGDQVIPVASSTTPANLGTAAIGTGITFARADHVHQIPILSTLTFGTGLSGTSYNTSSAVTIAIDSTVTTLTGSQTLTNKTLTSPAVTTSLTTGSTSFDLLNTTATTINIGGASTAISIGDTSHTGITSIQHDLYVYGNITFGGGSTQLSATELVINDPLIYIGDNNVADITDLGIVGAYNNGAHLHTGLVRDASDSVWKLFSGMTGEPTGSTLDFTGVTYAPLQVGSLTSTIATGTAPLTVTSTTLVSNLNADYLDGQHGSYYTTAANLTGTASININGTVGATTPNTGNFSLAQVGVGSGAVSLSINDGYGNANVCFNHYNGTPDNTSVGAGLGSSARITAGVDSSTGSLSFQVGNATSSGVAIGLTTVETMTTTGTTSYVNFTAPVLISNVATGTAPFVVTSTTPVANLNIGGNAVTAGGLAVATGVNNVANQIVRTNGSGYLDTGWINTVSGDSGIANRLTRIYASTDAYVRYLSLLDFKVSMGLSGKNNYSRRIDYSADANYQVGSMGHDGIGLNEVFNGGSGFIDSWNGTNSPAGHVQGFNALHYTTGSYNVTGTAYGIQVVGHYGGGGLLYSRGCSGGTFSAWRTQIDSVNIGSQSVNYAASAGTATNQSGGTVSATTGSFSGSLSGNGNIIINNGSPTLYFQDTNEQCAMLHNNSNLLYILRGGVNTTTWSTVGSGNWPMVVNLTNNDVTWGGNISAIYNITAYASDKRLKENIVEIPNAIEKIKKIRGVTFDWNDISETHGFIPQQKYNDVGVIAQEIEEVLPQVVTLAPFDTWIADPDTNYTPEELEEKSGKSKSGENYKTVQYDRIVPLLIQAIKEQQVQIDELKELINKGK